MPADKTLDEGTPKKQLTMALYSFIMEFKGGTCTSQHQAENIIAACMAWKDYISSGPIEGLKLADFLEAFDDYLDDMPPVPIDTLTNFWAWGFAFGGGPKGKMSQMQTFEVYIIRTDPVQEVVSESVGEEMSSI